jgi:hypothetical protein
MDLPWVVSAALAALIAPAVLMLTVPDLTLRTTAIITSLFTAIAWCGWLFQLDPQLTVAQPLACFCAACVSAWLIWLTIRPQQSSANQPSTKE